MPAQFRQEQAQQQQGRQIEQIDAGGKIEEKIEIGGQKNDLGKIVEQEVEQFEHGNFYFSLQRSIRMGLLTFGEIL